jgi:hypothetical protein
MSGSHGAPDRLHLSRRGQDAAGFEPMGKQVEACQRSELTDVRAKVVSYQAFVEGKLDAREVPGANRARFLFRTEVRRVQASNDLEPLECLHISLQGTRTDSTI